MSSQDDQDDKKNHDENITNENDNDSVGDESHESEESSVAIQLASPNSTKPLVIDDNMDRSEGTQTSLLGGQMKQVFETFNTNMDEAISDFRQELNHQGGQNRPSITSLTPPLMEDVSMQSFSAGVSTLPSSSDTENIFARLRRLDRERFTGEGEQQDGDSSTNGNSSSSTAKMRRQQMDHSGITLVSEMSLSMTTGRLRPSSRNTSLIARAQKVPVLQEEEREAELVGVGIQVPVQEQQCPSLEEPLTGISSSNHQRRRTFAQQNRQNARRFKKKNDDLEDATQTCSSVDKEFVPTVRKLGTKPTQLDLPALKVIGQAAAMAVFCMCLYFATIGFFWNPNVSDGPPITIFIQPQDGDEIKPQFWDPSVYTGLHKATAVPTAPEPLTVTDLGPLPASTLPAIQSGKTSPQSQAFHWLKADPHWAQYDLARRRQRFALAVLYFSTNPVFDHVWNHGGQWLSYTVEECDWIIPLDKETNGNLCGNTSSTYHPSKNPGEAIDHTKKTITRLPLQNNNLAGQLPPELSLLSGLKELRLDGNQLTGTIPEAWGFKFQVLNFQKQYWNPTVITLHNNQLQGTFPDTEWCSLRQGLKFDCKTGTEHGICGCGCPC